MFTTWLRTALSIFDMSLLLWLGFTIFFNSKERSKGIWLTTGGLIMGSLFFFTHTILFRQEVVLNHYFNIGWYWIIVLSMILLPIGWYGEILWYTGFWDDTNRSLRQRQTIWLGLILLGGVVGLAELFLRSVLTQNFFSRSFEYELFRVPIDSWGYAAYVVLCLALSLDALIRPTPPRRWMGEVARQRARVWLIGASVLFLGLAIGLGWLIVWLSGNIRVGNFYILDQRTLNMIGRFDLALLMLATASVLMIGQAIVSYELFTGRVLPRRGLQSYWYRAIFLAGGLCSLVGILLTTELQPIYSVLLTTILSILLYAILSWRAYIERDRYMVALRPLVAERFDLLDEDSAETPHTTSSFEAICTTLLDCECAYLITLGAFATFVPPQQWPSTPKRFLPMVNDLLPNWYLPERLYYELPSQEYGGAQWAVPLWSERGINGVLLLGHKARQGLYTHEEIEIARASCERLIESQANQIMATRLMQLQRRQLVQTQLLDQRTRRVVHDEILPLLHTTLLSLNGDQKEEAMGQLMQAHQELSALLRSLPTTTTVTVARLGLLGALRQVIQSEFQAMFDEIVWSVGEDVMVASKNLAGVSAETVFSAAREAVRNANKYARHPERPLVLIIEGKLSADKLILTIQDNGIGIDTTALGGHGLLLHTTMMAVIGGSLVVESRLQEYSKIILTIPLSFVID